MNQRQPSPHNWAPPPDNFFKLNSDGSLRDGIATAGGIIRNHRGEWVAGFSMNIGPSSIQDSEIWGLRQGLFLALQTGIKNLIVESDSLEAIQALNQDISPTTPAPALVLDCKGLLLKFEATRLRHSPRETNHAADFLAKIGHDLPQGVSIHESPPTGVLSIICNDISGLGLKTF